MMMETDDLYKRNRLAREKSPYLLQHATNPVHWFAWGEEALSLAKREGKIIFLSIGYSTCHWCHVMAHESFEDPGIAEMLNREFICIKVDREERPDIDQIYMSAVQAMTGSGGWPLSVFLTPDLKPFMGGTYFPPEDRWGRVGMKTLIPRLAELWKNQRSEILQSSEELTRLLQHPTSTPPKSLFSPEIFEKAFHQYAQRFDPIHGGFGPAPKFPSSHNLSFLLRYWKKSKNADALNMVEKTLQNMAQGGMYDQLAGGFHRYSTDERWLVPHFEKMLYDQALLSRTYLEAFQATANPLYEKIARETLDYVLTQMTDKEGGFDSAEDADSEGKEGTFYVWTQNEILEILGEKDGKIICQYFGVTEKGNFEEGESILYQALPREQICEFTGKNEQELDTFMKASKKSLFLARKKRIAPHLDDKILTAWNGLMISALAVAGRVFSEPRYLEAAQSSARFILKRLLRHGRLLRRYRNGDSDFQGYHDDYAFLISGLWELYQTDFDLDWLEQVEHFMEEMIRLFWDEKDGGFFFSGNDAEVLIARPKEFYDGAIPSSNSVAAHLLIRLGRLLQKPHWEKMGRVVFDQNAQALNEHPTAFPEMLMAYDFALGPSAEIVVSGTDSAELKKFVGIISQRFLPNVITVLQDESLQGQELSKRIPWAGRQKALNGLTTAYICSGYRCHPPIQDPVQFQTALTRL